MIPNLGHLPHCTYRDRASGILAQPGAFAPGPKLPDVGRQVSYPAYGDHCHVYPVDKDQDTNKPKVHHGG